MPILKTPEKTDASVDKEGKDVQQQASQAETMVELRSVSKTYANSYHALLDVSINIKKGEFLFITGPSGSGKSTFLKLLYGQELPTQGEVIVDDLNVANLQGDRLSFFRRRIGIVFQDYKLIPQRTVSENIIFVLQAQGYTRKEIQRRLEPTLKLVGLLSKADRFPDQLSGGEQQRVSIARAIIATPPLLLADEPTGNLDPDNSWQVIQILQKLNTFGATVIVTTHDEQLVRRCNHPVVQVKNGRLFRK
ncbi:cell division ATP-binding protein FtsE [Anabaena cylindrica UHCC 0172]|uniref:cell division ATP-binding protein FtsE n=1 Tax=Anabaena cylindrica TaxID=1165 RepID=UPI002B206D7D|nr:cell division ATP-binding protein FtsE [Anabaena cylindrica]MEA5552220.1 cell division ATP-binding protein FtsE [Anabaena cylindrica UHCC 0172]